MIRYYFFSVFVFDSIGRFKSSITGTLLFDKFPSFEDVEERALKGKRILSGDTVVLAGFSEISKEYFDSLKDEKRS